MRRLPIALLALASLAPTLGAQVASHGAVATPGTGGNTFDSPGEIWYPHDRMKQDRLVDMFFGDWRESMPRAEFGSLVLRDILTRGSQLAPTTRGAILESANSLSYGRLAAGASTVPTTLKGRQLVLYVEDGTGEISGGAKHIALRKDIAVLVPESLEFTLTSAPGADLTMYVIDEPTPANFKPNKEILMADERKVEKRVPLIPSQYTYAGASGHWAHTVRDLFNVHDGLATVQDVITVELNPVSLGEPHPHLPGKEEIWLQMEGTSLAFLGPQLRMQTPGEAYMVRPDGTTEHSNINNSDQVVKFLWFNTNTGVAASSLASAKRK